MVASRIVPPVLSSFDLASFNDCGVVLLLVLSAILVNLRTRIVSTASRL